MLSFLNLKYESRLFNPVDKEHKSEKFLELNPFGQVPVLKDGNLILRDSQAILVYLARAYGESHWFPDDPTKSAEIVAWLSTAANEVSRGPSALRVHYLLGRTIRSKAGYRKSSQFVRKKIKFAKLVSNGRIEYR